MRHAVLALVALSALLAVPNASAKLAEVQDPSPIAVPAGKTVAEVVRAVKYSIASQGWAVDEEQPGRIVASYKPRSHVARVTVTIAPEQVTIQYLSSENLKFEEEKGKRLIHPAYNGWVRGLRDNMERTVIAGVAEGTAMPTVAGTTATNPAPTEKFGNFGRFELLEATMGPPFAGQKANDDALRNIRHNINLNLGPYVELWNSKGAPGARLLRIEPAVEHIRFVGSGARFFAGRMAGRSSVIVKVKYTDVATGNTIAYPEFYLVADAANGFTLAANDYKMLENIGAIVAEYTKANYLDAVGGGAMTPADFKRK